ncbi:hypothetical protein QSE00_21600 [Arenibacter sp. M-2]|uniref:hypothetical protein n=1 Tax=Arenibacter sp. M-2 TaxID=3053612 RepID=UPI002570D6E8|nr:hypothetical protein [Arenibacter sp. M-2]MDL5514423.1 hypothetical protein [Arenibacter sp. M-2]
MKNEELRSVSVGHRIGKFHHWVIKVVDVDDDTSQISNALIEFPGGKLEELSHSHITFLD